MSGNQRDSGKAAVDAKINGKPQTNGSAKRGPKILKDNSKKKKAPSSTTTTTTNQTNLDKLVNQLYDKNSKQGMPQKQQRKKLQEYLSAQVQGTDSATSSSSSGGLAPKSFSDSSASEESSDDELGDMTSPSSSSSLSASDSDEMSEYTLSSSTPEVPAIAKTSGARAELKRRNKEKEALAADPNNNRAPPAKNKNTAEGPGPASSNPRIQRRVTMAGGLVHTEPVTGETGALHCPLKRKSVASCPLPAKAKSPNPTQPAKAAPESKAAGSAKSKAPVVPRLKEDAKNKPGPSARGVSPAVDIEITSCISLPSPAGLPASGSTSPAAGKISPKPGTSASAKPSTSASAKPSTSKSSAKSSSDKSNDAAASGPTTSAAAKKKEESSKSGDKAKSKDYHKVNSIEEGRRILQWILNPVQPDEFFGSFWEKNACQVQRQTPKYFAELISFEMIDEMLIRHHLEFTTNIDVTTYKDGVRQTLNPEGRAMPPAVWSSYADGCSIRILNPSTYLAGLRQVCSMLQEFFHCLVGANVYLTPPNSQGFAPHYDDIEAFVLQVEGRKRWRLYMPVKPTDMLARHSSGNFDQGELDEPIFDEVLEAGDVLYFPRGTVHQAITEKDQHSLHITLSVYQQQAYANLLENLMPMVLKNAVQQKMALRRGLPLHTWQNLGLAHGGSEGRSRLNLITGIQQMVQKYLLPTEEQIDAAVDQLAKRFQHEALPPTILPEERVRTVFGSRSQTDAQGQCLCDYEITEQTSVRLLRANILRLVAEEGILRLYYYVDNALEYCKYDANFMEIEPTEAAAVEMLLHSYPAYIKVGQLPLHSGDRRVDVATALWERGLLMTEKPFK